MNIDSGDAPYLETGPPLTEEEQRAAQESWAGFWNGLTPEQRAAITKPIDYRCPACTRRIIDDYEEIMASVRAPLKKKQDHSE